MSVVPRAEASPEGAEKRPPIRVPDHDLLMVIGRGSYGEVWQARNVMGTSRAVKIVRRQDFGYARPFEREFEGIQSYEPISRTHAGLVQVLHIGMGADREHFYYVMELADAAEPEDGELAHPLDYKPKTLRGEMHRRGALPVGECVAIGTTLASALGHLHRHGLVHRDVKPSNVIFVNGAPQLADVGLVAKLGDTQSLVGTEGYFAPEGTGQAQSDIYSLGKVLYECVTGNDRTKFPDVPPEWANDAEGRAAFEFMEIVLKAAEPSRSRRYANMEEMLADLALLQAGKSVRHLRRVEKNLKRTMQVLGLAAVTLAVAGGAWLYERHQRGRVERAQSETMRAKEQLQTLLGESLIQEARAVRMNGQSLAREKALGAVARGLQAGADLRQLRTEAASALALVDVGVFSEPWPAAPSAGAQTLWSGDGSFLVTCSRDGQAKIVQREGMKELASLAIPGGMAGLGLSPGAKWLAIVHPDHGFSLWDARAGKEAWRLPPGPQFPTMEFSRDGDWMVLSRPDGLHAARCADGASVLLAAGAPAMRQLLLAPDGAWLAALVSDEKEFGFRVYTGLPGGQPTAEQAATIRESKLDSDIRLHGASVSADSRYLAAAVAEDRLRVWEVPSMSQVAWLRGHQRSVRGTAFHPRDSSLVASTSWDGSLRLWDIPTRQQILVAQAAGGEELMLAPEHGDLLLRSWDGATVKFAPLSESRAMKVLMLPTLTPFGLFESLSFSPDGRDLVAAGDAGVVAWDLRSGESQSLRRGRPQEWRDAVFAKDGGALWFGGRPGLWRSTITRDADGKAAFSKPEQALTQTVGHLCWAGERLVINGFFGNGKGGLQLLRPDGSRESIQTDFYPDAIGASKDGRWVAGTRYPGPGGVIWDLAANPPQAHPVETAARASINFLSTSPLVAVGTDKEMRFQNLPGMNAEVPPSLPRKDAEVIPARMAESPDGGLVAVATGPTEVTLCRGRTLEPLAALDSPLTPFDCVLAFSPDGKQLALAGGVSRVVIWEVAWIKEQLEAAGLGW